MGKLGEIAAAIAAFERKPDDTTAEDLEFSTRVPCAKAFFEAADRVQPSDRLMNALMLADAVLTAAPSPSALTVYYSKRIRWHALLILMREKRYQDAVQALLNSPPLFSYLTDEYMKKMT